jgi:hypothetical protein
MLSRIVAEKRNPGLHRQVDPRERRRAAVVREARVAKLDPPTAGRQGRGAGGADDPRLAVEELEDPVPRGNRALRHSQRDPEHPHREHQHQDVQVEAGELADRYRA